MDTALQRETVHLGAARTPGVLEVMPRSQGLVLMAPRLQVLRASVHLQRLLQILHAQRLATFSLSRGAPQVLQLALQWLAERSDLCALPLGLWLDRTAAMQALALAAQHPARVGAVVSVNAQLDVDVTWLPQVHAASLLLLLGAHPAQRELHDQAMAVLRCSKRLETVPLPASGVAGAGAADAVAQIASAWLSTHLAQRRLL